MVSPDNLSIVIILDLLLMTRVHWISGLVWLEKARLLLDRIRLHHNVMLHQLWLVTSLQEKIKLKHCFPSSHYLQHPEVGSVWNVVYILYQKSNMWNGIMKSNAMVIIAEKPTLVKLTSISSSESLSSSSAASTKLETFFFSFSFRRKCFQAKFTENLF